MSAWGEFSGGRRYGWAGAWRRAAAGGWALMACAALGGCAFIEAASAPNAPTDPAALDAIAERRGALAPAGAYLSASDALGVVVVAPPVGAPMALGAALAEAVAAELGDVVARDALARAPRAFAATGVAADVSAGDERFWLFEWRLRDIDAPAAGARIVYAEQRVFAGADGLSDEVVRALARRSADGLARAAAALEASPAALAPVEPAAPRLADGAPAAEAESPDHVPDQASSQPASRSETERAVEPVAEPVAESAAETAALASGDYDVGPVAAPPPVATAVDKGGPTAASAPPLVAIGRIEGATGDGADALRRALRAELARSGVRLESDAAALGSADYEVSAVVTVERRGVVDDVEIVWTVRRGGRELGRIVQQADTPSGALSRSWREQAGFAAAGARAGALRIIQADRAKQAE